MKVGILLRVDGEHETIELDYANFLQTAYNKIEADYIYIDTIDVDGVLVDVVVDDEGLLKDNPIATVITNVRELFGNAILLPSDVDEEGGYFRGFTEEELNTVKKNIHTLIDFTNGVLRDVLEVKE